jgi:hypothetical protein
MHFRGYPAIISTYIRNEQIGFKAGCRTSDHIFKLKTIIDKYLNKSKKQFMPVL